MILTPEMKTWYGLVATVGTIGRFSRMPGTLGSVAGTVLWILLGGAPLWLNLHHRLHGVIENIAEQRIYVCPFHKIDGAAVGNARQRDPFFGALQALFRQNDIQHLVVGTDVGVVDQDRALDLSYGLVGKPFVFADRMDLVPQVVALIIDQRNALLRQFILLLFFAQQPLRKTKLVFQRPRTYQPELDIQQKQAGTAVCAHNGGQISHNAPTESQQKHNRKQQRHGRA